MSTQLQPLDIATFFASLDRRLDERGPVAEGEVDDAKRDVELMVADVDKKLVLLGFGEGDIETPLAKRVADRLQKLEGDDWSRPASLEPNDRSLLDHVRSVVDDASSALRV